jgi:D-hydroxyproline dehydrogenase subunit alpha
VTVDALLMNAGFEPQNEVLRLLGAAMSYDPAAGHLRATRAETLETTVPGLWAVGDCAGLGGAPAARAEGRIAGRAAAARAGHGDAYDLFADQRELAPPPPVPAAALGAARHRAQGHPATCPTTR